jgi:hypothetical protein
MSKQTDPGRQEIGRWVPGAGEGREGKFVLNGQSVSVGRWKVPKVDGGDGCTAM